MLSMQTQIVDNKKVYAYDKTLKVIQEFNTDYILNIVDRSEVMALDSACKRNYYTVL